MNVAPPIRVLCVDDNKQVGEAIERAVKQAVPDLEFVGWVASADGLLEHVKRAEPDVVLLDVDMPGADPITALGEMSSLHPPPAARVVMLSGHVLPQHINRAIEAGAWGYISKNQPMEAVLDAVRRVHAGDFVLSPEVQMVLDRA